METSRIAQFNRMTKDRWDAIEACKKAISNGEYYDYQLPFLSPEIRASWNRCLSRHVSPSPLHLNRKPPLNLIPNDAIFGSIPFYAIANLFANIYPDSNFPVYLHIQDKYERYAFLPTSNAFQLFSGMEELANDEDVGGTTAITLAKRYLKPIQVQNIEHFNDTFTGIIATAAPILDTNGELLFILSLIYPSSQTPWEEQDQIMCMQILHLITAIASALENHINLHQSYKEKEQIILQLDTVLSIVNEGIISVDSLGEILTINKEGMRLLGLPKNKYQENLSSYLKNDSQLLSAIHTGMELEAEETFNVRGNKIPCYVVCRPIIDYKNKNHNGAVIRINLQEKINKQAVSRVGNTAYFKFDDLIGNHPLFYRAIDIGKKAAASKENILLIGESGTGKELFAQAIHNYYDPKGPFIAINCAAIPRELIESELFGYESGSFTGASRVGRPGKIELADGGTLFLDEIGDMPPELQPVLLRVLENNEVTRIGGMHPIKVSFRVIAATNHPTNKLISSHYFRRDLFYRLSTFTINLPSLRERKSDIPALCDYFLNQYCLKNNRPIPKILPETCKYLMEYSWPGNVRQLEHSVIYAVAISDSDKIGLNHLPDDILNPIEDQNGTQTNSGIISVKEQEKREIEKALIRTDFKIYQAAELLGLSKSTLYRKIKKYGLPCKDNLYHDD